MPDPLAVLVVGGVAALYVAGYAMAARAGRALAPERHRVRLAELAAAEARPAGGMGGADGALARAGTIARLPKVHLGRVVNREGEAEDRVDAWMRLAAG